jgi:hypothetical protein
MECSGCGPISDTLSNLPVWAEEKYKRTEDGRFSDKNPKLGLFKYKLKALLLVPGCFLF